MEKSEPAVLGFRAIITEVRELAGEGFSRSGQKNKTSDAGCGAELVKKAVSDRMGDLGKGASSSLKKTSVMDESRTEKIGDSGENCQLRPSSNILGKKKNYELRG